MFEGLSVKHRLSVEDKSPETATREPCTVCTTGCSVLHRSQILSVLTKQQKRIYIAASSLRGEHARWLPEFPPQILQPRFLRWLVLIVLPTHAAPPLSGAIFTTIADGSIVNANVQYQSKCEVYLDGGPGPNAPVGAAGLPAGDYYFQVTDPSGKKLLSTDPVSNRRFTVSSAGIITAYTGSGGPPHPTGLNPNDGAVTIQLANNTCPTDYLDTPNNGGVYKAWVTPVGDGTLAGGGFVGDPTLVDNPCGNGCFHGFIPARSKTDNFKVKGAKLATF